jgi:hypothetical protein
MARTTTNNWVVSPSHVMVVVPDPQQLDAFPTDPRAVGPWVMWKGTKYAHLMPAALDVSRVIFSNGRLRGA